MKKIISFSLLFFSFFILSTKTVIFPFKVDPKDKKAYQWLGRAFSFYLTNSLKLNDIESLSDPETHSILDLNNINFPFYITKASGIRLAQKNNIDIIIWGEITCNSNDEQPLLEIKSYLMDLKDYSQKYLPLMKGHINDFYKIMKELLKYILKNFGLEAEQMLYPQLQLNYHGYEILIKSFLLKDISKKINFLNNSHIKTEDSDFLNFELAKCYLEKGDFKKSKSFLNKISENKLLKYEKIFLQALWDFHQGYRKSAIEKFIFLKKNNQFIWATNNNLGILYLKEKDYNLAEKCLTYAIDKRNDPEFYLNFIQLLILKGKKNQAIKQLNKALSLFPENENLGEFFSFFLSTSDNQELFFEIFQKYIQELHIIKTLPEIPFMVKNPFIPEVEKESQIKENTKEIISLYQTGNLKEAQENIEELLEINPFIPSLYTIMSKTYFRKKYYSMAEKYAQCAFFLERSEINIMLLKKIFKTSGQKNKLKKLQVLAWQLFPESKKLKKAFR